MEQKDVQIFIGPALFAASIVCPFLIQDGPPWLWGLVSAATAVLVVVIVLREDRFQRFLASLKGGLPVTLTIVFLGCGLGGVVGYWIASKVASSRQEKVVQFDEAQARMQAAQARMVDSQARLEFLQQRADSIEHAILRVYLDKHHKTHEMGDFRVLLRTSNSHGVVFYSAYGPAEEDAPAIEINGHLLPRLGTRVTVWRADGNYKVVDIPVDRFEHRAAPTDLIEVVSGKGSGYEKLGDFDNAIVSIWMTENLWNKTAAIAFEANKYVLLNLPRRCLTTTMNEHTVPPITFEWPEHRAPKSGEALMKVVPANYRPDEIFPRLAFEFRFSEHTPLSISKIQGNRFEIEFPKCDGYGQVKP